MVNDENEKYNFIAYAASPKLIGETLEPINHSRTKVPTKTWSQLDILGNSINQEVYDGITNSIDFIADISVLNCTLGCFCSRSANGFNFHFLSERNFSKFEILTCEEYFLSLSTNG